MPDCSASSPNDSDPFVRDLSVSDPWPHELASLADQGLKRTLRTVEGVSGIHIRVGGRELINICGNNYLGLAGHPRVVEAVREAVGKWGWGSGASPLITGHQEPHASLARRLAAFKFKEAALLCSTGYQANHVALHTLAGRGDVVFLDKLNHASIIDAARSCGAVVRVYPHGGYEKLERLLDAGSDARRRVIVTDSLFSMDGDMADLKKLAALKARYDARLMIDEAHATGVWGEHGSGLAEHFGVDEDVDVVVGTLSKALGGIGGFVAGSRSFIEYAVSIARAFIYSTSLPAAACAATEAALDVVRDEPWRRTKVRELAEKLRAELTRLGFNTGASTSQIIPLIVGSAERALTLSRRLEDHGFLIAAIRPPTVPRDQCRLRISLSAEHESEHVDRLIATLSPR